MHKEYLKEGPLSKFAPLVQEFAKDIEGEGLDLMFNIHKTVAEELFDKGEPRGTSEERGDMLLKEHQKRTAEDILKSDYTYGCDELGILIATIARLKGIPTKYIQCSDVVPYLKEQGLPGQVYGHVYLEFYLDTGTYLMDSTKGTMIKIQNDGQKQNLYRSKNCKQMVEAAFGLDPNDAGIFSHLDLIKLLEKTNTKYIEMTGYKLEER